MGHSEPPREHLARPQGGHGSLPSAWESRESLSPSGLPQGRGWVSCTHRRRRSRGSGRARGGRRPRSAGSGAWSCWPAPGGGGRRRARGSGRPCAGPAAPCRAGPAAPAARPGSPRTTWARRPGRRRRGRRRPPRAGGAAGRAARPAGGPARPWGSGCRGGERRGAAAECRRRAASRPPRDPATAGRSPGAGSPPRSGTWCRSSRSAPRWPAAGRGAVGAEQLPGEAPWLQLRGCRRKRRSGAGSSRLQPPRDRPSPASPGPSRLRPPSHGFIRPFTAWLALTGLLKAPHGIMRSITASPDPAQLRPSQPGTLVPRRGGGGSPEGSHELPDLFLHLLCLCGASLTSRSSVKTRLNTQSERGEWFNSSVQAEQLDRLQ